MGEKLRKFKKKREVKRDVNGNWRSNGKFVPLKSIENSLMVRRNTLTKRFNALSEGTPVGKNGYTPEMVQQELDRINKQLTEIRTKKGTLNDKRGRKRTVLIKQA